MAEPLKNIYSRQFFDAFTETVRHVLPRFNKQKFIADIFNAEWDNKELKQRIRHIATTLNKYLPGSFNNQLNFIIRIIEDLKTQGIRAGFEYIFFPDFIEQYGLHDLKSSLKAIEVVTQFISCEFAIRPFLLQQPEKVMKQMLKWSKHPHEHVRRFSSEGCRPRLPWAMAIPQLKKDPSPILPILENLKNDPSLFVRKSVANNLNDIAKDHPGVVIKLATAWKGKSKETDWIIKHGSRTLLKKADPSIYKLFDLDETTACQVDDLKLNKSRLKIGDQLQFSFNLVTTGKKKGKLRIEYLVYYVKSSGKHSKKLFKLTENSYEPNTAYSFNKKQRFENLTTRKHYPGLHKIGIVVNGREMASKEFLLMNA